MVVFDKSEAQPCISEGGAQILERDTTFEFTLFSIDAYNSLWLFACKCTTGVSRWHIDGKHM